MPAENLSAPTERCRCPFPDCPSIGGELDIEQTESAYRLGQSKLYQCEICGRVASRCVYDCAGLNRPASRFCSHCGQPQWDPDAPLTLDAIWRVATVPEDLPVGAAGASVYNVRHGKPPAHPPSPPSPESTAKTVAAELVASLDNRLFPVRNELTSWSIAHGLIFLHQGGGGLAVIHSRGDLATGSLGRTSSVEKTPGPCWTESERTVFTIPDSWPEGVAAGYNLEFGRPYPPVVTADQRFVLFSAPYGVAALNLSDLPGWSVDPVSRPRVLANLGAQRHPEWILIAPPVPLESRGHDGRIEVSIGLLFAQLNQAGNDGGQAVQYVWQVIDLPTTADSSSVITAADLPGMERIALTGPYCQILVVHSRRRTAGTGLVFVTPHGMWAATLTYARRQERLRLMRLQSHTHHDSNRLLKGDLLLDAEVESRNRFRWRHLLYSDTVDAIEDNQLVLWFAQHSGTHEGVYRVLTFSWPDPESQAPTDGTATVSLLPVSDRPIVPVGLGLRDGLARAYFLTEDRGALCSHRAGEQKLTEEHGAFLPDMEHPVGLTLNDPLVFLLVRIEDGVEQGDYLQVRSIRSMEAPPLRWGPFRLEADPLYWGECVFICERRQDRLSIHRIALRAQAAMES